MLCDNRDFAGLTFTVPDKEPFAYEVIRGRTKVIYTEVSRAVRAGQTEVTCRG